MSMLHPTAGYILSVQEGAPPSVPSIGARGLIRRLAAQVRALAELPEQAERRSLWLRHNALEPVRPLVLVFPEDSWAEVLPADSLLLDDPFWRQQEWYLRHLIYRHESLCDDFVIEPDFPVTMAFRGTGWGVEVRTQGPGVPKGAWVYDPPLKSEADLDRLTLPTIEWDREATDRLVEVLSDTLGDILEVRPECPPTHANLVGEACAFRGIEQFMLDLHDRPEWTHRLMDILATGMERQALSLEEQGALTLNNHNHYTDSGGLGYSNELPAEGFDGNHVRLRDRWGFGVAQEGVGIGPDQHDEFILSYQLRLFDRCGLNAYGCCEPYHTKFEMLERVPRLRRVSISPWCELEPAAEACRNRWVFSWKPNPARVVGRFDPEMIRDDVRRALAVTRGCAVEMVHKDTFTVNNDCSRLETWARIAREEIDRAYP